MHLPFGLRSSLFRGSSRAGFIDSPPVSHITMSPPSSPSKDPHLRRRGDGLAPERPEREYLSALYLSTAEQVAKALAARNAWEEVIPIAQRILERDPYHEAACRLLVQGYWALGQRALAVRTYERFRQRLRRELGVEPTFSLAALRLELPLTPPDPGESSS